MPNLLGQPWTNCLLLRLVPIATSLQDQSAPHACQLLYMLKREESFHVACRREYACKCNGLCLDSQQTLQFQAHFNPAGAFRTLILKGTASIGGIVQKHHVDIAMFLNHKLRFLQAREHGLGQKQTHSIVSTHPTKARRPTAAHFVKRESLQQTGEAQGVQQESAKEWMALFLIVP